MLGFLWATKRRGPSTSKSSSLSALDRARSDGSSPSTAPTEQSAASAVSDQSFSSMRHYPGQVNKDISNDDSNNDSNNDSNSTNIFNFPNAKVHGGSEYNVTSPDCDSSAHFNGSAHFKGSTRHTMVEDYFRKPGNGKGSGKATPGHRSAPPSQMYAKFAQQQSAEPRRCPSPPPGGVRGGVDMEEVEVRANEELYRRATWRMYHRITAARIQNERESEDGMVAGGGHLNGG
eukprot:CAMPEP_0118654854 /NCGR_PEP_ID=MMETSP0785-20121206/12613_1 /TAXON_ID=91992 /ORGANISM="Bolidomonas pacifica, Strain CCMP 1866" /LENGTH=231 /DNA_ID=CAMNT_0006547545 /DNA_START=134 /DNA_END=826 /DNA_ORIENTATION=-